MKRTAWFLSFLVLLAVVSASPALGQAPQPQPPDKDYIIGPEDILEIQVWGNKDLNQTVFVRPDGRTSLPLVGEIGVAGKSVQQLQDLAFGDRVGRACHHVHHAHAAEGHHHLERARVDVIADPLLIDVVPRIRSSKVAEGPLVRCGPRIRTVCAHGRRQEDAVIWPRGGHVLTLPGRRRSFVDDVDRGSIGGDRRRRVHGPVTWVGDRDRF